MPLSWALRLPFLLLPIALVRRAPDIEGGFAFHVGVAVALALAGALGGWLASRHGERGVAVLRSAPFRYGSLVPLAVIGFVLSNVLARGIAAALELERLSPGGHLDAGVGLLVAAVWVARAAGRGAHPLAGAVVALAAFVVATVTQLADVVLVLPWRLVAWATAAAFARVALRPSSDPAAGPPAGLRVAAAVVFALVAVPLGAIAARFAAPFVPGSIEGVTLARGGALAAGALGVVLGARGGLHVDTLGALRLAALGVAALPLVVYLAVFYALTPPLFLVTGALFALVGLVGAFALHRPLASVIVALWLWFYVGFAWITAFKVGPDAESCAEILAATDTRVLLERYAEDAERLSAQPYDVLLDPVADSLLLTFKRIDTRGGFVDLVPRSPGAPTGRLVVRRPDRSGPLWPERFVRDPATGLYYFGMLGRDAFSLWEVEVDAGATEGATLRERRSWPLRYEPAYPAVDEARHLLVQPYLAGQVQNAPLLEVLDLDEPRPGERELGGISGAMAEYVAVDPSSGDYFVPMTHHGLGFDLLRVSGIDLAPVMRRPTYHPTIGLVADPAHGRLFATNPLAGTLVVYDLADLRPRFQVALGAFPRDIELDRERALLYVGTYADGEIVVLDVAEPDAPPRVRSRHPIGSLLRGISLDPSSGLVHAASACGAFELAPPGEAP